MKPYIDITYDRDAFLLAWFDEDGEGGRLDRDGKSMSDDAGHVAACKAAEACADSWNKSGEYIWDTESAAKKARAAVRKAVKLAEANRPMPDWAVKALAAGWKAPKGWKP